MPVKDNLLDKLAQLKSLHAGYHTQLEKNRRYYNRKFDYDVVPLLAQERGFVPYIPTTARQAIDEATDHILTHPKIRVPIRPTESESYSAQDIAERKRMFLAAFWRQVGQRTNALGDARKPLLNEGKVCVKKTLRWDVIPDNKTSVDYRKEIAKLGKYDFLWDIEILDNLTVYEDPSNHRDPRYVYLAYDIYVEEAKAMFPTATGNWTVLGDYDKVEFKEYWSAPTFKSNGEYEPGDFIQWVDEVRVHEGENPYPYIPIAIEDAGFGSNRKFATPEDKYVGISQHSHDIFVMQARQWSAMEAVAETTAFAPLLTRNIDESKLAQFNLEPGAIWQLEGGKDDPDAESVEFAQMPNIPITVPQVIQLTDRAANSTLKLDVLGGIAQSGVDTATEADQNVRNASAKLSAPVAALERLAAKLSKWVLMDIELVIEAPVTIYGVDSDDPAELSLSPRDISGYYDLRAELTTTDEDAISQNKARFWLEMALRAPFLSYFTALERGGVVDDPSVEMVRRAAEEVFLSEQFKQIRVMTGAQSFGELAQLITNMGMAEGMGSNPGGGMNGANTVGGAPAPPVTAPGVQNTLQQQALLSRDLNQGASQYRAF